MSDNDPSLMEQFEEFLQAKEAKRAQESKEEDEEVEIWDKDGRGARVRRSRAKPFLQSLGIDLDPESNSDEGDEGDDGKNAGKKSVRPTTGRQAANSSTVRKYFAKQTGKK